jgi:TRAP-type uncharacterized transport system fused permease subunit
MSLRIVGIAIACATASLIVGTVTIGTHGDPGAILAACSLTGFLANPYSRRRAAA